MKSGWDVLESGDYKAAVKLFLAEHRQRPSKGTLSNLGTAYLCMGDAKRALAYFEKSAKLPPTDSGSHASAGVACWLLRDHVAARKHWVDGLESEMQDLAGGMGLPLLLFFSAVRDPHLFDLNEAKRLVQMAGKHPWASEWPGPLGRFVLRQIDEAEVRRQAWFDQPEVYKRQLNEVEFYVAVLAAMDGDEEVYLNGMRKCASFSGCMLNDVWHLARFEISHV